MMRMSVNHWSFLFFSDGDQLQMSCPANKSQRFNHELGWRPLKHRNLWQCCCRQIYRSFDILTTENYNIWVKETRQGNQRCQDFSALGGCQPNLWLKRCRLASLAESLSSAAFSYLTLTLPLHDLQLVEPHYHFLLTKFSAMSSVRNPG